MGQEDSLEKELATQPSILVWEIPWTEEQVGYSPWGCKESDTTEQLNNSSRVLCNIPRPSVYHPSRKLAFRLHRASCFKGLFILNIGLLKMECPLCAQPLGLGVYRGEYPVNLTTPGDSLITPILPMRKPRPGEVKQLIENHLDRARAAINVSSLGSCLCHP